jgi:hypothetical protein
MERTTGPLGRIKANTPQSNIIQVYILNFKDDIKTLLESFLPKPPLQD